ncbi:WEB family protein At3g02930, chloroplastic-like [Phaseolus vulgaris]|uniref:WEB family protein At3g02930, chloroplastic-like n=1 Tax=Phaseolus vulgaris TaxID=3885 RepID=UPI0035C95B9A
MARSKITPNPPPSPRNPPTNTCRANPSSSRDPTRDPNVPSSQAVRPAPSQPNQAQPNPPHTSAAVRPLPNYKQLYSCASATLLGETSSINSERDILRLKKGDQTHLSFSKEHDDKVSVHPCPPGELICTDMMLGKDRMAELCSIAKLHNLAAGSQTVPNSVAEIAAAQVAEAVPEELADTQASSQPTEELPASSARLETPLAIQPCEGGGEHQPPPPPPTPGLLASLQEALRTFNVRLHAMANECLPQIVAEGLQGSLEKLELDCRIHQEVASTARAEAEKIKCDLMMQGLEFSRVENALKDELQSVRTNNKELRKKLHDKLQNAVELENRIVPLREKIATLEEPTKELSETATELARVREENSGFKKKFDALELEVTQVREENNGFKTKIDDLQLEAAQVLTSGFGAALEQFACKFPDLDLSEFSVYNEVVDGKIMPPT